ARHVAARVEHEDRVVGDALNEDAELLLALAQRLGSALAFADVARDAAEPDECALGVVDRVDQNLRPVARAVLAHPPAFGLEAALDCRLADDLIGHAGATILFGVETGEVVTEDFGRGVTGSLLRAGAPAGDPALRVERAHLEAADRIDDRAESHVVA